METSGYDQFINAYYGNRKKQKQKQKQKTKTKKSNSNKISQPRVSLYTRNVARKLLGLPNT